MKRNWLGASARTSRGRTRIRLPWCIAVKGRPHLLLYQASPPLVPLQVPLPIISWNESTRTKINRKSHRKRSSGKCRPNTGELVSWLPVLMLICVRFQSSSPALQFISRKTAATQVHVHVIEGRSRVKIGKVCIDSGS